MLVVAVHVYVCLCIVDVETVEALESELYKDRSRVTSGGKLTDYLSCEININENKKKSTLTQHHLIKKRYGKEHTYVSDSWDI